MRCPGIASLYDVNYFVCHSNGLILLKDLFEIMVILHRSPLTPLFIDNFIFLMYYCSID